MRAKFGHDPTVVSKKRGTERQTDTHRQTDKGTLDLYIVDKLVRILWETCVKLNTTQNLQRYQFIVCSPQSVKMRP